MSEPQLQCEIVGRFEPQSEEWLAARRTGLGASDAASVLGVEGAYRSPISIWADKLNLEVVSEEDRERENEFTYWGNTLEPKILEETGKRLKTDVVQATAMCRSKSHPFMIANPDGWVDFGDTGWGVVEAKNVTEWLADQWEDEPPLKFQVQLQHQMAVTGLSIGVIGALIGGNRFRFQVMPRNNDFIAAMVPKLQDFWGYVERKEMPPATGRDVEILKKLYIGKEAKIITLPVEAHKLDQQWLEVKQQIKHWKKREAEVEAQFRTMLGDATVGVLPGGGVYRIIKVDRVGFTVAPSIYNYLKRIR